MATPLPSPATAADLVFAARNGGAPALTELYGRFSPALFRLAYRLTASREDAEDVVHDVFVGLPEALAGYEERGRLEAWLKRVTARVALMRRRSQRRRREVALADGSAAVPPRPDTIALEIAVDGLPESLRCVVVLKEIEGYSHAEIGEMLGISTVASRVRLARALRRLRLTLGEAP